MKLTTNTLVCAVGALATAFWLQAQGAPPAVPKPGNHVVPQGTWQQQLPLDSAGNPVNGVVGTEIQASGPNYTFTGAKITQVAPSPDADWDWVTLYEGGTLTLVNAPDAPWFNKNVPTGTEFVYRDVAVVNWTRSTRYDYTLDAGRIDFDLTGSTAGMVMRGVYSGTPGVLESGPTPPAPYSESVWVGGALTTAEMRVTPAVAVPGKIADVKVKL